jgi:hypothetical protein
MILYHVTAKASLPSIDREGLKARCGDFCIGDNKGRKGVYFWRHQNMGMNTAAKWGVGTKGGCVLVTVEIPDSHLGSLQRDTEYFEDETEAWVFPTDIPRSWITSIQKAKRAWHEIKVWGMTF